jgi:hypothetical protein
MLAIEASQHRMELADKADVLTLAIDAAATIQAENRLDERLSADDGHVPARPADLRQDPQRRTADRRRTARQRGRWRPSNGGGTGEAAREKAMREGGEGGGLDRKVSDNPADRLPDWRITLPMVLSRLAPYPARLAARGQLS